MNSPADNESINRQEQDKQKKSRSFIRSQLPIFLQIALCGGVIVFALTVRAIGGEFYAGISSAYFELYNRSILTGSSSASGVVHNNTDITEVSLTTDGTASDNSVKPVLPLKSGKLTSPYGKRTENGSEQFHKGVDIGAPEGTEICAVSGGEVTFAGNDPSYGKYVVLKHSSGEETLYAHCSALRVKKGDKVKSGSIIALVGSTGDSDGPHLHFEVKRNGQPVDPSYIIGDHYS